MAVSERCVIEEAVEEIRTSLGSEVAAKGGIEWTRKR